MKDKEYFLKIIKIEFKSGYFYHTAKEIDSFGDITSDGLKLAFCTITPQFQVNDLVKIPFPKKTEMPQRQITEFMDDEEEGEEMEDEEAKIEEE